MISPKANVIIFEGGSTLSPVEAELFQIRRAVLQDNLERILRFDDKLEGVTVVTNYPEIYRDASSFSGVKVHTPSTPFHFGEELHRVVNSYHMEKVLYLGNAGFPLLSDQELEYTLEHLLAEDCTVFTNNVQSSDLVAFSPGQALSSITLPNMDNSLAVLLRDEAGLTMEMLPTFPGVLFDLDTPADYLVLGCLSSIGYRTRQALENAPLDFNTMQEAASVLDDYYLEAALVGRVGAPLIAHINNHLKLRLRIFSEERGMKALGKLQAGEVVSLLGYYIEEMGLPKFFSYLEKVVQVAFIDSRVLFAHFKKDYTTEERFLSDLGRWQELRDPWLKEFTRLSAESSIPIILGGHSLVSGGLWVLTDELFSRS